MTLLDMIITELKAERVRQDEKWGRQRHDSATRTQILMAECDLATVSSLNDWHNNHYPDRITWADILLEEVYEAIADAEDYRKLRKELIQVAAVCIAWLEDIDEQHYSIHD